MERGRLAARQVRALRGTAAAVVAIIIAATSHTLAGGSAPPPWLLAAVIVLAAPVAVGLVGRRPALWRIAAAVTASQGLLHAAFAAVGENAPVAAAGHDHGALLLTVGTAVVAADPGMIAGHAVAALVTTVLLAGGERMLRALGRGIHRLLRRAAVALRTVSGPAPRASVSLLPRLPRVDLDSLSRRGPPALLG